MLYFCETEQSFNNRSVKESIPSPNINVEKFSSVSICDNLYDDQDYYLSSTTTCQDYFQELFDIFLTKGIILSRKF